MRSKEVEEAIKEGKDYIEFMTTAGDNAEWAETVLSYISELEEKVERFNKELDLDYVDNNFIPKDKIRDKIKELEENRDKYVEENKFGSYIEVEGRINELKELLGE